MEQFLLMNTCRVEALDVSWSAWVKEDWEHGSLVRTLADPACSLRYLSHSIVTNGAHVVGLSEFFITKLRMSRLRYLRIGLGTAHGAWGAESCRVIAEALENGACALLGLSLEVKRAEDARHLGSALVQPECNLRCLGLFFYDDSPAEGWDWLRQLLKNPACKLMDLRLQVPKSFPLLQNLGCGLERLAIYCNLGGIAKLPEFCHKLKEINMGCLSSPRDLAVALQPLDCKLEVLTADFSGFDGDSMQLFSEALLQKHLNLKCLTVYQEEFLDQRLYTPIFHALRSEDCKLESLLFLSDTFSESSAKSLVEALECNVKLCTLKADFPSRFRTRVTNLLTRNQLLKEGGLLQQPQVKPRSARLFLCGHERVGKTTIRKQIVGLVNKRGIISLHKVKRERPTRGMELQELTFEGNKKLVLCDLAGHKEYHAFHHFFLTGSDRDLFLVVCKATDRPDQREFSFKLRYWFRFIASHSTPGKPRPKVIVVLNFFTANLSTDAMTSIASDSTNTLMQQYADVLDFGRQVDVDNVFGINALKRRHFSPILHRLQDLLIELLDLKFSIPKICDDLWSIISTSGNPKPLFLPLRQIVSKYAEKFGKDIAETNGDAPFRAALVELHNAGEIVFFPPNDEQDDERQIVIVDCHWFCCKLIGTLMQPEEIMDFGQRTVPEPGVWLREDITKILLQQNCKPEYVTNVLQYLHRLELFYPLEDGMDRTLRLPPSKLMFPSLLPETQRSLQWQECEDRAVVFGRRLECKDKVKTLLPAGAFARLQVKLHSEFGNSSWKVGCGWISFMENCVAAIIRFGGETGRWEDRQWIDIMVRYPEPREQHENTAESIVLSVKRQIFSICQGIDRGFPSVLLEECVMSEGVIKALENISTDIVPLDTIKKKVCKKGIEYNLSWSDNRSTPILDLFLPGELRDFVSQDFKALREIALEFHVAEGDDDSRYARQSCEMRSDAGLSEDNRLLLQLLYAKLDVQEKILKDIVEGVSSIRNKMESLLQKLRHEEVHIFTTCSYQLVRDLLAGPLPAFPFLTDKKGLWQPIKNLMGKEVYLHFMCEWYAGAHEVEGQKGLSVKISRPNWLARAGPVLVPALKVACCAARLAAGVVLPGSQVFVPSFELLSGFGLNGDQLQQRVLPDILKWFVDKVPDLQELTSCQQPVDRSRLHDVVFDLVKGRNVDMECDFQLFRVEMPKNKRIAWVCRNHSEGLKRLKNQDPFQ